MMLGARTAAWAKIGAPLPYDAEVEYLESNGDRYIDTGIKADYGLIYRVDAETFINAGCVFGAYDRRMIMQINIDSYVLYNTSRIVRNPSGFRVGVRCEEILGPNIYKHDGVSLPATFGTENVNSNVVLFGRSENTSYSQNFKGRIFGFSISLNGNEIIDFIPVKKDGLGYMYDSVSGHLFGEVYARPFVIGPDKTT